MSLFVWMPSSPYPGYCFLDFLDFCNTDGFRCPRAILLVPAPPSFVYLPSPALPSRCSSSVSIKGGNASGCTANCLSYLMDARHLVCSWVGQTPDTSDPLFSQHLRLQWVCGACCQGPFMFCPISLDRPWLGLPWVLHLQWPISCRCWGWVSQLIELAKLLSVDESDPLIYECQRGGSFAVSMHLTVASNIVYSLPDVAPYAHPKYQFEYLFNTLSFKLLMNYVHTWYIHARLFICQCIHTSMARPNLFSIWVYMSPPHEALRRCYLTKLHLYQSLFRCHDFWVRNLEFNCGIYGRLRGSRSILRMWNAVRIFSGSLTRVVWQLLTSVATSSYFAEWGQHYEEIREECWERIDRENALKPPCFFSGVFREVERCWIWLSRYTQLVLNIGWLWYSNEGANGWFSKCCNAP